MKDQDRQAFRALYQGMIPAEQKTFYDQVIMGTRQQRAAWLRLSAPILGLTMEQRAMITLLETMTEADIKFIIASEIAAQVVPEVQKATAGVFQKILSGIGYFLSLGWLRKKK